MSLADEYRRQYVWRDWSTIYDALPPLAGRAILDLGCGIGDQSADFVARGARVIGVDLNEELLQAARARGLTGGEFRHGDLRAVGDLGGPFDGIWSSFAAAFFIDLPAVLTAWTRRLRPGGWIALTEIDDLFGHEPLSDRTRSLFQAYAADALSAVRYDFHMGRKMSRYMEQSGIIVAKVLTVPDSELSFDGPARPDVLAAWQNRLDRMKLLHDFCGPEFERLREEFLECVVSDQHHSTAKVYCCIGRLEPLESRSSNP
jgi:SAM-dependent methyltransferase